ncbi:hypothetical protein FRC03_011896 [Tulasnella sp. 419]|nr:hypothetical protein FRC03_011896 [Tulasnella sp. 419]
MQPSGEEAKIKWLTVGGRTPAVVAQVQINASGATTKSKKHRSTKAITRDESDDEDKDEEQSTNSLDEKETRLERGLDVLESEARRIFVITFQRRGSDQLCCSLTDQQ